MYRKQIPRFNTKKAIPYRCKLSVKMPAPPYIQTLPYRYEGLMLIYSFCSILCPSGKFGDLSHVFGALYSFDQSQNASLCAKEEF